MCYLAAVLDVVELEDGQVDLRLGVLHLLGRRVVLLLPLLGAAPQPQHQVEGGLLLDVVVRQGPELKSLYLA